MSKLNIGCGTRHLEGYVNIDCDAAVAPDLLVAVGAPLPLADGSVSAILLNHVVEHVPAERLAWQLADWHRVLAVGGQLRVVVPDIPTVLRRALATYLAAGDIDGQLYYGALGFTDRGEALRHNLLFSPWNLSEALARAGFWVRTIESGQRVEACGEVPISLVCEAEKPAPRAVQAALEAEVKALLAGQRPAPTPYQTRIDGVDGLTPLALMSRSLSAAMKTRLLRSALQDGRGLDVRLRIARLFSHDELGRLSDAERDRWLDWLLGEAELELGERREPQALALLPRYVRAADGARLGRLADLVRVAVQLAAPPYVALGLRLVLACDAPRRAALSSGGDGAPAAASRVVEPWLKALVELTD